MQNNKKIDLYIAIPFYNEEKRLPDLLNSFAEAMGSFSLSMVLVNHNSTDSSLSTIKEFENVFSELTVLEENYPIHCGGIPRNKALNKAIELAEINFKTYGIDAPIATVDSDTKVSKEFVNDIIRFLSYGYDVVSFPERYDQIKLLEWAKSQEEKNINISTRALIGLNFVRYSFLWGLILSDIIETRGPGGYGMYRKTWKKLHHCQPVDEEGNPVTGENNQLEIRANRLGLKSIASPHLTVVHPRREFSSSKGDKNKGYKKNKLGSEVFSLARELDENPILGETEWSGYILSGIKRAIKMVLIRAVAFNKIDNIKWWFPGNRDWLEILEETKKISSSGNYPKEEFDIVGSWIFKDIFEKVDNIIGDMAIASLIGIIDSSIPSNSNLFEWASNTKATIQPGSEIIEDLPNRYISYYKEKR